MSQLLKRCILLGVLCLLAPVMARAQSVIGQPVPEFEAKVEDGRVTMEWEREFGPAYYGHTIYAAYAPGGPIILQQFVPTVFGVDGVERPFVSYPIVPPGIYYVIVLFGMAPPTPALDGAWTRIDVGAGCTAAPNAPGMWDEDDGDASHISLQLREAEEGCPAEWFVLEAGSAPGLADLAVIPMQDTSYEGYPPLGTYYLRLRAANRFGGSVPSEEIVVSIAGCDPPAAPIGFAAQVTGSTVHLSWSPPLSGGIQTITGYALVASAQWPPVPVGFQVSASTTSLTVPGVPPGTYYVQMAAQTSCPSGTGLPSEMLTVVVP